MICCWKTTALSAVRSCHRGYHSFSPAGMPSAFSILYGWWWHLESWCETPSTSWLRKYSVKTINNFLELQSQHWTQRSCWSFRDASCCCSSLDVCCLRYSSLGAIFLIYTYDLCGSILHPEYMTLAVVLLSQMQTFCTCISKSKPCRSKAFFHYETSWIRKWAHGDTAKGSDPVVGLKGTCLAARMSKFWTDSSCM